MGRKRLSFVVLTSESKQPMKRGTGNKITEAVAKESILSIQLSLNGHSFCVSRYGNPLWLAHEPGLPGEPTDELLHRAVELREELRQPYRRIRVVSDTDRACLIPTEYDRKDAAVDYLRVNEIPFSPAEDRLFRACEHEGLVGLICLPATVADTLTACFPNAEIAFTHPLLLAMRRSDRGPVADICLSENGFVHVVVIPEEEPVYAATIPCAGTDALLFILSQLNERFGLSGYLLLFSGAGASDVRKEIAGYFRHTALDVPFSAGREMKHVDIPLFANLIRATYENY